VGQGEGDDEAHGLDQLVSIFSTEQARLLAAMHDEVKMLITFYVLSIVAILYVLLYRVGMASARRELNKTTNFVNILPFHVLSRQVRSASLAKFHSIMISDQMYTRAHTSSFCVPLGVSAIALSDPCSNPGHWHISIVAVRPNV